MIGTEFIPGYGLGNQLFFYIVTRCMAADKGVDFGFINPGQIGNVFHSQKGMYFMDIDLGIEIPAEDRISTLSSMSRMTGSTWAIQGTT